MNEYGSTYPKLSLDAGGCVGQAAFAQPLYMREEVARRYLGRAALDRLEHGVVHEDVLVLRLHHVVALRAQARHVTVDVDRLLVSDPLQHGVDDDERPRAADARTTPQHTPAHIVSYSGTVLQLPSP